MTDKSANEMVEEAKARIRQVTATEAMREAADGSVLIDCREPNEWNLARIPGAVFIPLGQLEQKVEALVPRDAKIIVYCARGNRSALGADTLNGMGYSDVASMAGGITGWVDAGGEIE